MEKYLNQLLEEMQKRGAVSPMHKQDVSSTDPLQEFMYNMAHGSGESYNDTIEDYCGIKLEQLPPQERLTEDETERLVGGIIDMWRDYGIGIQVPETTPVCVLYKLMREVWQEEMFLLRSGGLTIDFCSGNCPDCDLLPFCVSGQNSDWFKDENAQHDNDNKDRLDEPMMDMEEEQFIPGVYNYCNRWCAYCDFKERCRLFYIEKQEKKDMEDELDPIEAVEQNLEESISLLKDIAEEAFPELLDKDDGNETRKTIREIREEIHNHELFTKAEEYEKAVESWIEDYAVFRASGTIVPVFRQEIEVIMWYHPFIGVKIFRALSGLIDSKGIDEYSLHDANGTAKVVLQALDESRQAWMKLMAKVNDGTDGILDFINMLDHLDEMIHAYFPDAECFIRPGLDESPIE